MYTYTYRYNYIKLTHFLLIHALFRLGVLQNLQSPHFGALHPTQSLHRCRLLVEEVARQIHNIWELNPVIYVHCIPKMVHVVVEFCISIYVYIYVIPLLRQQQILTSRNNRVGDYRQIHRYINLSVPLNPTTHTMHTWDADCRVWHCHNKIRIYTITMVTANAYQQELNRWLQRYIHSQR